MGQYRQWLHQREIDRLLRVQLTTLKREMAQLDERIEIVRQETTLSADNAIVHALIQQQPATQAATDQRPQEAAGSHTPVLEQTQREMPEETPSTRVRQEERAGSISPALFAWGSLPNFASQDIPAPLQVVPVSRAVPPPSGPDEDLLPHDIHAFVNTYDQTVPQLKLPWWLRATLQLPQNPEIDGDTQHTEPSVPVDTQSNRTNQLVQRWFERRRRFAQQLQERRE